MCDYCVEEAKSSVYALARLLLSLLPPQLLLQMRACESMGQYWEEYEWLPLLSVRVHWHDKPTSMKEDSASESSLPVRTADCLRRINSLLCYMDSITCTGAHPAGARSKPRLLNELDSLSKNSSECLKNTFPGLVKVHNSGLEAFFTVLPRGSPESRHKYLYLLIAFAEHLLTVCDILNSGPGSRPAFFLPLNAGPSVCGLLGRGDKPQFGIWGEAFSQLRVLSSEIERRPCLSGKHYFVASPRVLEGLDKKNSTSWYHFDSKHASLRDANDVGGNAEGESLYFRLQGGPSAADLDPVLSSAITEHLTSLLTMLGLKKHVHKKSSLAAALTQLRVRQEPPPLPPHQKSYSGDLNDTARVMLAQRNSLNLLNRAPVSLFLIANKFWLFCNHSSKANRN
ncbi:hypothetical protein Ciccas_008609 [Cichlidogyrus casuarinus]|uniref:Uncharacterized protein n=1 Tax=Cichlidogyrus casuarinus TaxID=1844966 RepID=A0ABD2PZE5_9PLAT